MTEKDLGIAHFPCVLAWQLLNWEIRPTWTTPVHTNWGSTAGGSVATGSFRAFGTDQVEMQREDLRIHLFRDRARVEIDYVLHNTGPAVDVRAGFPS